MTFYVSTVTVLQCYLTSAKFNVHFKTEVDIWIQRPVMEYYVLR